MRLLSKIAVLLSLTAMCFASDLAVLRNGFSIRHEIRQQQGLITRLFLSADQASFVDVPTAEIERFEKDFSLPPPVKPDVEPSTSITEVINSAGSRYRLDPDFIDSVISAESGFNSRAVSRKGAAGLMQLMPGTATQLGVANPFDPATNVDGGTRYLRDLLERYNYDVAKALAAYNAGPNRVEQYRGVPPYRETRIYVNRIIRDYNRKKIAQQKGRGTAARKLPQATKTRSGPPASVNSR